MSWNSLMLVGPLFLVFAYIVVFWAARDVKAIRFLQSYEVKGQAHAAAVMAEQVADDATR